MHSCRLQAPATAAEWDAYYTIREDVFLEAREAGLRRSDEDEDQRPGHFPLLLWHDNEPVGTIRVDLLDGGRAALRLVAVHPSCQARGHGARLLQLAEAFARALGCGSSVVYSTLEAAGFYARAGYVDDPWDDGCIGGIVQMSKPL